VFEVPSVISLIGTPSFGPKIVFSPTGTRNVVFPWSVSVLLRGAKTFGIFAISVLLCGLSHGSSRWNCL